MKNQCNLNKLHVETITLKIILIRYKTVVNKKQRPALLKMYLAKILNTRCNMFRN